MKLEEFFNQMVETLGIIIDRRPKERPRKMESYTIEKNRMCCPILIKKLRGKRKSNIARSDPIIIA